MNVMHNYDIRMKVIIIYSIVDITYNKKISITVFITLFIACASKIYS